MNKVFEYSALGIPSVTYPLTETTRLLRGTASVSENDQPEGLAKACLTLLDDAAKRAEMGDRAQKLADEHFDWDHEAAKLRAAYDRFFPATTGAEVGEPEPLTDR
jgi:glycosyltransferase involved in cell wall biosynthesis